MADCSYRSTVEAYHDGELDAARGAEFERHLASCQPCTAELAGLRKMSGVFAAAPVNRLSQIGLYRLHANLDLLTDRGLLWLARVMTGLAASVLVVGSIWLTRAKPAVPVNGSVISLALQAEESATPNAEPNTEVSQAEPGSSEWISTELSR
jgi:anti-sigma factor RsiW